MNDKTTSVSDLKLIMAKFVNARDWQKFHSPKNLSASLAIEVAELMEHFQWLTEEESRAVKLDKDKMAHIKDEVADVASYLFSLCNVMGIDLSEAFRTKMVKNNLKYPSRLASGQIHRYTYSKRAPGKKK
jgi:NTP pyrophosphatase (non-canonical NTP hydrolase)